jgi:hypothetical protein
MLTRIVALLSTVAVLAAVPVEAHHSFAAEFDYDLTGTIEGEVVEVLFVNPHARYFVSVTGDDGTEAIWDAQTRSTSALTRVGWTRDLIKVGDRVVLEGNLGRDGARKLWIREIRTDSGRIIRPVEGGTEE